MVAMLSAGIAGLIILSKLRSEPTIGTPTTLTQLEAPAASQQAIGKPNSPSDSPPLANARSAVATEHPLAPGLARATNPVSPNTIVTEPDETPETRPLPEMEKAYLAATNRDDRLDIMMDIAESPSAEAVKTLTRLFQAEKDMDLQVDLIDSLLGIEDFKDEKLGMLTIATQANLPKEVRQAAVDGLIDLDDPRVVAVFNGLLNDPDEEIRDAAKDALEMVQAQPPIKLR